MRKPEECGGLEVRVLRHVRRVAILSVRAHLLGMAMHEWVGLICTWSAYVATGGVGKLVALAELDIHRGRDEAVRVLHGWWRLEEG